MVFQEKFPHRHNADDSYDSICRECLLTIATTAREADLREFEIPPRLRSTEPYRTSQGYLAIPSPGVRYPEKPWGSRLTFCKRHHGRCKSDGVRALKAQRLG
jgi:hypothetical protein